MSSTVPSRFDLEDPLLQVANAIRNLAPTRPTSIPFKIYCPMNQTFATSICNIEETYSTFAERIVLDFFEQSKLLPLLLSIHPDKLTAYKFLFGGNRSIIVKPTWKETFVIDGCVDINVVLRYQEGGESFMDTPNISIVRTLPTRYTQGDGQPVEMELVFYRLAKIDHSLPLYTHAPDKTKLIILEEDTEGRRCVYTATKDWNVNDKDCTLPNDWVSEFEKTPEEIEIKKRYLEERNMTDLNNGGAEVLPNGAHQRKSKAPAKGKKIAGKETNVTVQTHETSVGTKVTAAKTKNRKKKAASTKALEEDAAPKEPSNGKSGGSLSIMEAAKQLAMAEQTKKTKAKKQKVDNTTKMATDSRSKNETDSSKTIAGKDAANKDLAKDINGENASDVTTQQSEKRNRSMSIGDSQERLTVLERAKALAEANPADVHTGTMAKIIAEREKKEHANASESPIKNSSTAKKLGDTSDIDVRDGKHAFYPVTEIISANKAKETSKKRSAEKGKDSKKNDKKSKPSVNAEKSSHTSEKSAAKKSSKSSSNVASSPAKVVSQLEHASPSQSTKKKQVHEEEEEELQPAEYIAKGWVSKKVQRPNGKSDTYFLTPRDRIKLRSKVEALKLIAKLKETNGDEKQALKLVKQDGKMKTPDKGKKRMAEEIADGGDDAAKESKKKKKKSKRNKKDENKLDKEENTGSVVSQDY